MNEITRDEARESLGIINEAMEVARRAVARVGGKIVVGWGLAYLLGSLAVHFAGNTGMLALNLMIVAAAVWTGVAASRGAVKGGKNGARFGISWGVLFGFGAVWYLIWMPEKMAELDAAKVSKQIWVYGVSLAMFMYVLMGLWWDRIYVVLGLVVTAATVAGLFLVPAEWFWIWSSLAGGLPLLAGGLWLIKRGGAGC